MEISQARTRNMTTTNSFWSGESTTLEPSSVNTLDGGRRWKVRKRPPLIPWGPPIRISTPPPCGMWPHLPVAISNQGIHPVGSFPTKFRDHMRIGVHGQCDLRMPKDIHDYACRDPLN